MRRLARLTRSRGVRPGNRSAALLGRVAAPLVAAALLAASLLVAGAATAVLAADPTQGPGATPRPPTCAERYPAAGPAGLDLRLGCIIGEVVGQYTAAATAETTPASTYALFALGIVVAGLVALWLAGRFLRGAAGRRLAPVRPGEWWLCGTCRSVNAVGVQHCYSCGAPPPDAPTLRTDDAPSTTQSFGSSRKRG